MLVKASGLLNATIQGREQRGLNPSLRLQGAEYETKKNRKFKKYCAL